MAVTEDIKRTPARKPKINISTRTEFEKRLNNFKETHKKH